VIGNPEQRRWYSPCGIDDRQTPRLVSACKEATNVELLLQSGVAVAERPVGVNLRHERFVPTSPLNSNLPPLLAHPQAAAVRHSRRSRLGRTTSEIFLN
jgi:hypothetical protein